MRGNDPKLAHLTTVNNFRARIAAVLSDIQGLGYCDVHIAGVSTMAQSREPHSSLRHRLTLGGSPLESVGEKEGILAEIVPKSVGSNASKRFWMMLGWSCREHNIGWGGLLGLPAAHVGVVVTAMERLKAKGWPTGDDSDYEVALGWAPAWCSIVADWPSL